MPGIPKSEEPNIKRREQEERRRDDAMTSKEPRSTVLSITSRFNIWSGLLASNPILRGQSQDRACPTSFRENNLLRSNTAIMQINQVSPLVLTSSEATSVDSIY